MVVGATCVIDDATGKAGRSAELAKLFSRGKGRGAEAIAVVGGLDGGFWRCAPDCGATATTDGQTGDTVQGREAVNPDAVFVGTVITVGGREK